MVTYSEEDVRRFTEQQNRNRAIAIGEKPAHIPADAVEAGQEVSVLHKAIKDLCVSLGWQYFYNQPHKRSTATKGQPDFIIAASRGRTYYVEAKAGTGRLSEDQQCVKEQLEANGHILHVVRSMSEFKELI